MSNWNKDMTVREAFEKAFGPIPEGATCHMGVIYQGTKTTLPTHALDGKVHMAANCWTRCFSFDPLGHDISSLPAWVFAEAGVLGDKFNQAVKE